MKFIPFSIISLWFLCDLMVVVLSISNFPEETYRFGRDSHVTYKYDRISEVQKQCASVLSASSELRSEYSGITGMKSELSFVNGDWKQDDGKFPIMPFNAGQSPEDHTPLKLVSFWVTDVDHANRLKKSVPVNGFMAIGITRDGSFVDSAYDENPEFRLWPSHSQLSIPFQGVYTESKRNGGERVLCLLGNTMLPARESDPANPWEWMKNPGEIPLSEDDQILLVLRYPMTLTLMNRIISGELRSLNRDSNPKYFDVVHISSQLGKSAKYMFGLQPIVSKACNLYPYKDNLTDDGISFYKGTRFCEILEEITGEKPLSVVPNWRCNGTDDFCSKLGPFSSDKEIKSTDGGFQDVKLYMQDVFCMQAANTRNTGSGSARVSAVFRAVSPAENQYTAARRSGPNNMSLAAEGLWKSSSSQLCMVGCLGSVDAKGSSCDTRICLYIPTTFSLQQRSIIFGTLSPIDNSSAFFPLSFEQLVQPAELWNYFKFTRPNYSYTETDSAGTVLEKNEPFSFSTVIKKSLLTFPKLEDNDAFQDSLSLLSEDLSFHVLGFPDPMPNIRPSSNVDIQMEILSVGPRFGRYWYARNSSTSEPGASFHAEAAEFTEKQLLINVSAQLSLSGKSYSNFSVLFLEGLYDPHVGKMYLIGCRDVRASWKVLYQSYDLEAGMDCLIEVVVSYPPTTTRWLVHPTATISIESQRTDDDTLRFNTIKLKTFPIIYRKQREDILSHRGVEGILRILTLSFAVGCILSQIFYIKHNVDSLPYISLVVLSVQALGYSIPLITGAEALFKKLASESYDASSGELENSEWLNVIDYTVKLLLIVSLLLTLRLFQKVWKSRIRLQTRNPLCVPSDKRVFLCTFITHLVGYVIVLIVHSAKKSLNPLRARTYFIDRANSHSLPDWTTELEEYVGLVEDFFLFPQIIGNLIWHIDCKPLRKLYYIGITLVRLLPHVYDYIRVPIPNPYFSEESEFVNPSLDFYSKFGDVAIPVTAIILAVVVYVQQRWSYEKLSQILTFGNYKLLPTFRYERLSSKSCETEMVGGGENEKDQADVE